MNSSQTTPPQTQLKILLIGDSCTDRYNIGTVDRLSPEAPVPVIKIVESYDVSGMAANVHDNLTNLNCWIAFITNREDIVKTRYIDQRSGQHLLRVDDEPAIEPWDGDIGSLSWETYDAVVISDYNKGFLTYQHIEQIIRNFQGPVFIDTKKTDVGRFQGAWVKINELELKSQNPLLLRDRSIVQTWDIETYSSRGEVPEVVLTEIDENGNKIVGTELTDIVFMICSSFHFKDDTNEELDDLNS